MDVRVNRPKFTLPNVELIDPIIKDPPRSYFTKQKTLAGDNDVRNEIENAYDRYEEVIRKVPSGQNNFVNVSYSNAGGNGATLTTMPQRQAQNPIRLAVVRPPEIDLDALKSLSRPFRQKIAATTNADISSHAYAMNSQRPNIDAKTLRKHIQEKVLTSSRPTISKRIDKLDQKLANRKAIKQKQHQSVKTGVYDSTRDVPILFDNDVLNNIIRNNVQYIGTQAAFSDLNQNIDQHRTLLDAHAIRQFKNHLSHSTNPSFYVNTQDVNSDSILTQSAIKESQMLNTANSNLRVVVYDVNTHDSKEIDGSLADKINIAVQAASNLPLTFQSASGEKIKLSNYQASTISSNPSNSILQINSIQPTEMILDRNTPMYYVNTGVRGLPQDYTHSSDNIILESKLPNTAAQTNVKLKSFETQKPPENLQLKRNQQLVASQPNLKMTKQLDHTEYSNSKPTQPNITTHTNASIQNTGFDLDSRNDRFNEAAIKEKVIMQPEYQNQGFLPLFERQTPQLRGIKSNQLIKDQFDEY